MICVNKFETRLIIYVIRFLSAAVPGVRIRLFSRDRFQHFIHNSLLHVVR